MTLRTEHLCLDATAWQTTDDVWSALLVALGAPAWHGRNLDALADSLRGGDLNVVNPPFAIEVHGVEATSAEARLALARIASVFRNLADDGVPVAWAQS
jgi:RNAse (barnase) inhibitor barstar